MIRKDIELHLEALAGYINDEDKLVTYKWLSKELGIHVNLSKQILFEYWENRHKDKKNALIATFLLMGYLEDGGMRVEVVKEADLSATKKNFDRIIAEHIYSLQNSLPEIELLAITDKGDSQQSAVHCIESVIRSDYEMEVLRWGTNLTNNKTDKSIQSSLPKIQKQTSSEIKQIEQTNNVISKESTPKITAVVKPTEKTQKTAFNNLFAKAMGKQNKEKMSALESANNKKSKKQEATKNPQQKNAWFEAAKKPRIDKEVPRKNDDSIQSTVDAKISKELVPSDDIKSQATLLKSDSPPEKNSWYQTKKNPKSEKEQPETSNGSVEVKDKEKQKQKSPEKDVSSGKIGSKKKPAASSRGKKRLSSAKNESINKKRKRIIIVESSEESSGSEMEDIREPESPEKPQIEQIRSCPSPPLVKCEGGRRKVRKLVDKTYMDEDGYFVTQKEYVYESCSDKEEEEVQVDVIKPSSSEPTVKNGNKRKQATLLNFFKKS